MSFVIQGHSFSTRVDRALFYLSLSVDANEHLCLLFEENLVTSTCFPFITDSISMLFCIFCLLALPSVRARGKIDPRDETDLIALLRSTESVAASVELRDIECQ